MPESGVFDRPVKRVEGRVSVRRAHRGGETWLIPTRLCYARATRHSQTAIWIRFEHFFPTTLSRHTPGKVRFPGTIRGRRGIWILRTNRVHDRGHIQARDTRQIGERHPRSRHGFLPTGAGAIALDSRTVGALRSWRVQQAQERLGPAWLDSGLVFTAKNRSLIHPDRFHSLLKRHVLALVFRASDSTISGTLTRHSRYRPGSTLR